MSRTAESFMSHLSANSAGRFAAGLFNYTTAVVLLATVFGLMMVLGVVQISGRRAWFFWLFTAALSLEATGYGALAYLSLHETSHTAYLISMAFLTLAPSLLAVATFNAHGRITSLAPHLPSKGSFRTLGLPERLIAPVFTCLQLPAILFFVFGITALARLHSPEPIRGREDAIARLAHESDALERLQMGYTFQFFSLGLFIIAANGSSVWAHVGNNARAVYWAMNWVALFNLIRTASKVLDFLTPGPENLDILGSGLGAIAIDTLPLFMAFALFLKYHPGKIQHDRILLELDIEPKSHVFTSYEHPGNC